MKIYLATADPAQVSWAAELGLTDGVITTPRLLYEAGAVTDPRGLIQEICLAVSGPVVVAVESIHPDEMYRDGKELARLSDQIVVEVPLIEDGLPAIRRLSAEGIRVSAGLVFSATQAVLASRAGASVVNCAIRQMDAGGTDAMIVLSEMRAALDQAGEECDVLASVVASSSDFTRSVLAGADGIAIEPEAMRALLIHPLTDRGMDRMLTELSRLPKGRLTNA